MTIAKQTDRISARIPHHVYEKLIEAAETIGCNIKPVSCTVCPRKSRPDT